jgi:hypothetical protein
VELAGPPTPFVVRFTPRVLKWLRKHRGVAADIIREANRLRVTPEAGEPFAGNLVPSRALKFSLSQGGEYRIAYLFRPEHGRCVVWLVGPRENFYRHAEAEYRRYLAGEEPESDDE